MMFSRTEAVNKILKLAKRLKVIQGGTWAGKTFAIIAIAMNLCCVSPNRDVLVVAESVPALKAGALKDFQSIMQMTGRWVQDRYNATDRIYRFANGSKIKFDSFDSEGKAKAAGKRTDLFINEANHIPFKVADALITRTTQNVWIDFNPDNEFWAHEEIVTRPDADFLILNYKDNGALPSTILEDLKLKVQKAFFDPNKNWNDERNIKNKYWANWCRVYVAGEVGSLEGVVFSNWSQIDNLPEGAKPIGYGIDFGYMNDPSAVVMLYEYNGERILDEVIYEMGLVNTEIARLMKANDIPKTIIGCGDSAEPKSIGEINRYKFNVKPTEKGKDSILYGINIIQQQHFRVTSRSLNLIKELRKYKWAVDKSGKRLNVPVDAFNHAIDAARYIFQEKYGKPKRSGFRASA